MDIQGRSIAGGIARGNLLKTNMGISFFGGVDPETGVIHEKDHELEGTCIAGTILAFPAGKGSTVGSYSIYRMKKNGVAPLAIINRDSEPITAIGCILAEIPCVDQINFDLIPNDGLVQVDGDHGIITIFDEP